MQNPIRVHGPKGNDCMIARSLTERCKIEQKDETA